MKKRLVICCDGTWNAPDSAHVTNIEKIARTISTAVIEGDPPVQQLVLYLHGVGSSGYLADRLLGGAFGYGLFDNIRAAYRFLALNYDEDDEIFVFGFSRGAYTARSLVGMIGRVGLLTRQSLIAGQLPEAVDRYRRRPPGHRSFHGSSDERFKQVHSHARSDITFLGVFDTVGALGVPGAVGRRHQFHDVQLGDHVHVARQALAIDEHRMKFEPSLWETPPDGSRSAEAGHGRVKQVWFEGCHSDVGGGYGQTGLSDTALEWMAGEAKKEGLAFDETLLAVYTHSGSPAIRHESLTGPYRVMNLASRLRLRLLRLADQRRAVPRPPGGPAFQGHDRLLDRPRALAVLLASSAATHYSQDRRDEERERTTHPDATSRRSGPREWYHPPNLCTFDTETDGFTGREEPVVEHP
jgi:Uncharacterized alpha/beta hydrolase domain (DUF2235)